MFTKEVFNREMNELAVVFEKEIPLRLVQIAFDKLSGIIESDDDLVETFSKLLEEKYYPRIGKMIEVAREVRLVRRAGKDSSDPWVSVECSCGNSFALKRRALMSSNGVAPCPGVFYGRCKTYFSSEVLKHFAKDATQDVTFTARGNRASSKSTDRKSNRSP